jgi:parallel beta-helix repeat protein
VRRCATLSVLVALVLLSVGAFASPHGIVPVLASPSSYQPHSGIYITNDTSFTSANGVTGGNGSASNPYVIRGWEIDSGVTGIDIRYTSVFFVIRDVYLHGLSTGISFLYVVNGRITNSTVSNNSNGIELSTSTYDQVDNNNVTGNKEGILFSSQSRYDSCMNNTVTGSLDQGITVWQLAVNITVTGNMLVSNSWALVVADSSGTVIARNRVLSNTLGLDEEASKDTWILENNFAGDGEWIATYLSGILYVYHNNFLSRTNSPGIFISYPNSPPYLDNGYPSGGNFWYDYAGTDKCSGPSQNICSSTDGLGDTPYQVDFLDQDNYPLVRPYGPAPASGPVWPSGSSLNASSIGVGSLTLTWTPAIDSYGIYRYHVYRSGVIVADVSGTTFQAANLTLGANYSFKVEAGDAWGNYTHDGPSLSLRLLLPGPVLALQSFYVGTPFAGGSTLLMNNFTNLGQNIDQVTQLTVTSDLGTWSLPGLPFSLASGESRVVNMTVSIPIAAHSGNHTITLTGYWKYYDPQTGVWSDAPHLIISGSLPVDGNPQSRQPQQPPNTPTLAALGSLDSLLSMARQLIYPGIAAYLSLLVLAAMLVLRDHNRKSGPFQLSPYCSRCGLKADLHDSFCANCGAHL